MFNLLPHQEKVIPKLRTGSILRGGVGSGKTIASLGYFYTAECGGVLKPEMSALKRPKDLYVITVARKRDSLDWEREAAFFMISKDPTCSVNGVKLTVDSWNNINKYKEIKNAFFIFDEQKVVGSGAWVKAFLKITKTNNWILLSATPGDTWMDYVPVFIANGFYKNRTDFIHQHVVYNTFTSYPKIDRYVNQGKLTRLKKQVLIEMEYEKKSVNNIVKLAIPYDKDKFNTVYEQRWNPYKDKPIQNGSEYYYTMRQVVNSDLSRSEAILQLQKKHKKIIVFYSFDYELEILRKLQDSITIPMTEYNGHLHESIPQGDQWIYLVNYASAGEAWNCIETNTVVLYSRNYSYKKTIQAMGRIDRQNTPFVNLYYYFLTSDSWVDKAIAKSFAQKKNFNERNSNGSKKW